MHGNDRPPESEVAAPEGTATHHDHQAVTPHDISSSEIIGLADTMRFLTEILGAAENGLPEDDIAAAFGQFTEWHVTAAIVEMWHRREITLRWDSAKQDLVLLQGGEPAKIYDHRDDPCLCGSTRVTVYAKTNWWRTNCADCMQPLGVIPRTGR
jgi:hypothetical protein